MAKSCVSADEECCILLVFGVPATGKTSLVRELVSRTGLLWRDDVHCVHMCADDFYPPDLRELSMSMISDEPDGIPNPMEQFRWKDCRKTINSNIEKCLAVNKMGILMEDGNYETERKWKEFLRKMCERNNNVEMKITQDGKFTADHTIIIVDDNLPLRSMRYEYYQMARKAQIGFCEAFITCELETAQKWNDERLHPIPSRALVAMATMVEPPEQSKHPWEKYSIIMNSDHWWDHGDRWNEICGKVYGLCERALKDPAKPVISQEDIILKEASRKTTFENLVHQVDQKLRGCVSTSLQRYIDNNSMENKDVAHEAKHLNGVRKTILAEFRSGLIEVQETSDDGYKDAVFKVIHDRFTTLH